MVRWLPLWFPIVLSAFASLPGVLIAWRMVEPPKHEARPSFLDTGRAAVRRVWHSRALWSAILLMALGTTGIMTMGIALQPLAVGYGPRQKKGRDPGVMLWDTAEQRIRLTLPGMLKAHALEFTPDQRSLLLASSQRAEKRVCDKCQHHESSD